MYPGIDHDIFYSQHAKCFNSKNILYILASNFLKIIKVSWLINRLKKIHAVFLINPYGSMEISEKFSKVFKNDFVNARFPQEKLYAELMHFYFLGN